MKSFSENNKDNQEVITFKVDESLKKLLIGMKNRSEFIRNAILSALENSCPVCKGAGVLTPHRLNHWNAIITNHDGEFCGDCKDPILKDPVLEESA